MKLAFYKGKGTWFDKLIRWWTKSPYSHCELVFSDGAFFSADAREGKVRYKYIYLEPKKWDTVPVPLDTFGENVVRKWCNERVNKKYDWLGIFFCHVIDVGLEDGGRYFCSEICCKALQRAGLLKDVNASRLDPGELYKKVKP